jgi:hypothetical protein
LKGLYAGFLARELRRDHRGRALDLLETDHEGENGGDQGEDQEDEPRN